MLRQRKPLGHLRLVAQDELPRVVMTEVARALEYANRHGVTWYLHQGTTKTEKPKYYVAKSVGRGALNEMPFGFEFSESVNGVVSVRHVDSSPKRVAAADVELVRAEVGRHRHLRHHRVEVGKAEIVIYEPAGGMSDGELQRTARELGVRADLFEQQMAKLSATRRHQPVMRFLASTTDSSGEYLVERMSFRGKGGWSYPLAHGSLATLVGDFVRHVGTQQFFELY